MPHQQTPLARIAMIVLVVIGVLVAVVLFLALSQTDLARQGRAGYWPVFSWPTPMPRARGSTVGACYNSLFQCDSKTVSQCFGDDQYENAKTIWQAGDQENPCPSEYVDGVMGVGITDAQALSDFNATFAAQQAQWRQDGLTCGHAAGPKKSSGVLYPYIPNQKVTIIVQYFYCQPTGPLPSPY